MRNVLFSALTAMALSACNQAEPTDQGKHADAIEQPAPTSGHEPARNVPGGGSGTAASQEQDSGHGAEADAARQRDQEPAP